jgi:hypothetical protein
MRIADEDQLAIAEAQAEALKAQPDRRISVVLYESLRDALNKLRPGRKGRAGERKVLRLYYGLLVARRAQRLVSAARRALFETDAPPFREWRDAERWLQEREREGGLRPEQAPFIAEKARKALHELDLPVDLESIRPLTLVYSSPDGTRGGLCCFPVRSPLAELRKWVRLVMDATGWWEEGTVAHILVGALPLVLTPALSVPQGTPPHVDATLWPWHLRAVPALPALMTEGLSPKERRAFLQHMAFPQVHTLDAQLLLLMESEGYPPPSRGRGRATGQGEYWQRMSHEWRKTYGQDIQPEALRKRWARMPQGVKHSLHTDAPA